MIIANIKPDETQELVFDMKIEGSREEPSEIRFVIESQTVDGKDVQDVFSIICRAVREDDAIKVYIPRLLNLFRSGSHKARLEVVLENRLFIPLSEEILIEEPISIKIPKAIAPVVESPRSQTPEVTVTLTNIIKEMLKKEDVEDTTVKEDVVEVQKPKRNPVDIDKSWRVDGFKGIKNPFK